MYLVQYKLMISIHSLSFLLLTMYTLLVSWAVWCLSSFGTSFASWQMTKYPVREVHLPNTGQRIFFFFFLHFHLFFLLLWPGYLYWDTIRIVGTQAHRDALLLRFKGSRYKTKHTTFIIS
jgi:hypothetical protein